jgi:hypothetical protein
MATHTHPASVSHNCRNPITSWCHTHDVLHTTMPKGKYYKTYATTQNMHVSCWCHASSHHQHLCLSGATLLCKIAEAAMITERWHNPNDHGGSNPNVNNCAARASHTISWFHHCWTACTRQHTWFRRARLYWMVAQSKRSNPMWSWCAYTGSPNVRCSSMGGSFAFLIGDGRLYQIMYHVLACRRNLCMTGLWMMTWFAYRTRSFVFFWSAIFHLTE